MKKQSNRQGKGSVDDLPELFDMTERAKASNATSRVKKQPPEEVWIGSLAESVELPNELDRQKSMRLSQQVQIGIHSSPKKEDGAAPANRDAPAASQRSALVESQV